MGHTTGTSDSLEGRVRETTPEGLHWSRRFCQVREIQQIQARGGSRLMAEAADGRDGWSASRGGSTIDVIGAGQMMAHLAGAGSGARDQRPGGHSLLGGERASAGCAASGWLSQPGFATRPACFWGLCTCVCSSVCLCARTFICDCQCASVSVELCVFRTLGMRLCVDLCVWPCLRVCVRIHARPQSVRAPFSLDAVHLCVQVCVGLSKAWGPFLL